MILIKESYLKSKYGPVIPDTMVGILSLLYFSSLHLQSAALLCWGQTQETFRQKKRPKRVHGNTQTLPFNVNVYTAVFFASRDVWFSTGTTWRRQRSSVTHRRSATVAPPNTNLGRAAQVLHPWNLSVLQAVLFRTAEVFWAVVAFVNVQQAAACCCRQLEVQTLRVAGQVLLRAALAGGSFLLSLCRSLTLLLLLLHTPPLLNLAALTSSRLLSSLCICRWTRLALARSCVLVPGAWGVQYGLVGGACDGATPPGQSAVARLLRRSETWPLARSRIIVPVKLRETGFPCFGGRQRTSRQGAITEILKGKK